MERHTTDTSPDLVEKIVERSDDMGWAIDSVRRMYVDPQAPAAAKVRSKRKYHNKSRVPDNESALDSNWNVAHERLTDEQLAINRKGIAQVRAAAQHEAVPYDPKKMVEAALASWEHVVADSVQVHTATEVSERGAYVGLNERHVALNAIAGISAQRNRAEGFRQALDDPAHAVELFARYKDKDPELIAQKMAQTALKNQPKLEAAVATLAKQDELLAQGFPLDDVAFTIEATELEIVGALGSDVHHDSRNKALKHVRQATKKRS